MHRRNLLIIAIVVPGCLLACAAQDRTGQGKRFAEVIYRIDKGYFRTVDSEQLFQAAMEGVFRKLDDRSEYIEPSKLKNYERDFKKEERNRTKNAAEQCDARSADKTHLISLFLH